MNVDITSKSTFVTPSDMDTGKFRALSKQLQVRSHGLTDIGKRRTNEDQFAIAELRKVMRVLNSSFSQPQEHVAQEVGHLFVVADGVGGHAGGQEASQAAVTELEDFLLDMFCWFYDLHTGEEAPVFHEFQQALAQVDARVIAEGQRHPQLTGMSTTLTMGLLLDDYLFVGHAGDSRCYLYREAELVPITKDHTLAADIAEAENRDVNEMKTTSNLWTNVLTNAIGGQSTGIRVDVHKLQLNQGDWLLFCTDGLPNVLSKSEINNTLASSTDPRAACKSLIGMVQESGGSDNTTIITVEIQ
ncbi:MAG: PP2C family protein-serine/threonine phosphatase [Gemmataceae bacterium]